MSRYIPSLSIALLCCFLTGTASASERDAQPLVLPLDMDGLRKELSFVRGSAQPQETWPREVSYTFKIYDFKTDSYQEEKRTCVIKKKPLRIIPHAVGVAEILWAICPRERLVAFNEFTADPDFSFIAEEVQKKGPIFKSKQTELVIGYRPDLVFTVFYSGADFKEKLTQARIPHFDLGYFGTLESIKDQILLIGTVIGEETNARQLVTRIDTNIKELQSKLPRRAQPVRVLYYDEGGYVPGISSNFTSICTVIGAVNVATEHGIKSWSQIDFETLLKWNPDVIIVPARSNLKELLTSNRILSHAQAIKNGAVYPMPGVYLRVDSQFMVLSANLLAGIIYRQPR